MVAQLIELNSNADGAGERRVRATLKPLKKSHRDSDEMETQQRIKLLTDENCRSRQRLKEVLKHTCLLFDLAPHVLLFDGPQSFLLNFGQFVRPFDCLLQTLGMSG